MILIADASKGRARPSSGAGPTNEEVADTLERIAELLRTQRANPFRVGAYLGAARTVRRAPRPVVAILRDEGVGGLERFPHIGRSIAALIEEFVETGRVRLLDRLEGLVSPEDAFTAVPGIGEVLAGRIHRELGIETLEELEVAAHDGRLAEVEGFGERRVQGVRLALAGMLGRSRRRRARRSSPTPAAGARRTEGRVHPGPPGVRDGGGEDRPGASRFGEARSEGPSVAEILSVDAEYRRRAAAGELRRIAPRRFNPDGVAWLPILHTERGGWHFTALHSNTALAHRLGRTHDWVVAYWDRDGDEGQATVVTEYRGLLEGLRVVRGQEEECLEHYRREGRIWEEDRGAGEGAARRGAAGNGRRFGSPGLTGEQESLAVV